MNQILIEHLDPTAWRAKPPGKARTIGAIFTHPQKEEGRLEERRKLVAQQTTLTERITLLKQRLRRGNGGHQ